MADFKLRAPPRVRFHGVVSFDGVFGAGGTVGLAGDAVARAVGQAALLRGINLAGAGVASSQATAALLKGIRLSGAAVAGAQASVSIDDWTPRANAAGVVFANRLQDSTALNAYKFTDVYTTREPTLDTVNKPTGAVASFKFTRENADTTSGEMVKIPFGQNFGNGTEFWLSVRQWASAEALFQPYPTDAETGRKLLFVSTSALSHDSNTIVLQDTYQHARVYGYYYNSIGSGVNNFLGNVSTDLNSSDIATPPTDRASLVHNSAFATYPLAGVNPDTGAAWSNYENQRARYGPLYTAFSTPGAADVKAGIGDPISGAYRMWPGEWMTLTMRVIVGTFGSANSRITVWAARQNSQYFRLWDFQNVQIGSVGSSPFSAIWYNPYISSGQAGGRKVGSRTNNIGGVVIRAVGADWNAGALVGTPVGAGTLEYNATTKLFRWAGNGETFGTGRGYNVAAGKTRLNVISSNPESYLVIEVTDATALPASGIVTDTITIADGRPTQQYNLADVIISTTPISAPGGYFPFETTSTLATVVAAMPARSWIQFDGTTQNGVACPVPSNLASIGLSGDSTAEASGQPSTVYANKANWNPVSRCIEIIGRYHGLTPNGKYARYIEATHAFDARYFTPDSAINHNFDMNTVNPATGEVYVKPFNSGSIARFASGGDPRAAELAPLTTVPSHPPNSINNGIDWWSGSGTITGGGAQGVLLVLENDDANSYIRRYEPVSNTWLSSLSVPGYPASGPQYNGLLVYSKTKNVAIFCVGHRANTQLWRINADGTIDKYASTAPVYVHHTGANIVADPVTGNFLVSGNYNGSFYEFNPDGSGTWTNLNAGPTQGRLPSNVNWNTSSNGFPGITVTSLYEHGAVCYLSNDGFGTGAMHIYKHGP